MRPCHAVEILLTRPANPRELRYIRRNTWLAVNADRTRLLAVQRARNPGAALHQLRRRLEARLPLDVLSTHYPDRRGQVLLNVALAPATGRALRRDAAALGQRPQDVLRQRVITALAREEERRARHLKDRFDRLLTDHTPEEVLAGAIALTHKRRSHSSPVTP
ncbi:hypothetical protein [Streptomyces tauricus]|uniref:hypothetical protein n=1 Tax=Streptomyces tauricus TaxID=68274 RepID=UPI0033A8000B